MNSEIEFWGKVLVTENPTDCWLWKAGVTPKGYGGLLYKHSSGNLQLAHRVSWTLTFGIIPKGLCVCHKCDNPPCCNPSHLFLGTIQENNLDRDRKGRQRSATGGNNGARLHPERLARGSRHGSRTHPEALRRGDNHPSRTNPENMCRGIDHPLAKLNPESVRIIRKEFSRGASAEELGLRYGVCSLSIMNTVLRETWKHVLDEDV